MFWPYIFLTFVAGILFRTNFAWASVVALTALAVFAYFDLRRAPKRFLFFILLGCALGGLLSNLREPLLRGTPPPLAGNGEITGISRKSVVITIPDGTKLRLLGIRNGEGPPKHAQIFYRCEIPQSSGIVSRGESRAANNVYKVETHINDGIPQGFIFERLSGIRVWCRIKELKVTVEPSGLLATYRERALGFLNARFRQMECSDSACTSSKRTLVAAFLLGDTDTLSSDELFAFRDMGLMHLFAVSGLNIALLFALLYLPFRLFGSPALGAALGYAVATAFLLLLDFPVPLLRAWLFMTIALGLKLFDRRIGAWSLLFMTAVVVELWFPLSSFTVSFILSFGVTAAILVFYEPIHFCFASKNRFVNLISEHTALSLAAGFFALCLSFFLFGTANPLSLVYNLLLVPFSGLYLFTALIFLFFAPAKILLVGLDTLYFQAAEWHMHYAARFFPVADPLSQTLSLVLLLFGLFVFLIFYSRQRLWSVRRNLRLTVFVLAFTLFTPFALTRYPERAFFAIPNKVWYYNTRQIFEQGENIFSSTDLPRFCFPVSGDAVIPPQDNMKEFLNFSGECFLFTARMTPERWPSAFLKPCTRVNVLQAKTAQTSESEWQTLFRLYGFSGAVEIRRFFTWYADRPLVCSRSEKL